jgi:hypothetical protein
MKSTGRRPRITRRRPSQGQSIPSIASVSAIRTELVSIATDTVPLDGAFHSPGVVTAWLDKTLPVTA